MFQSPAFIGTINAHVHSKMKIDLLIVNGKPNLPVKAKEKISLYPMNGLTFQRIYDEVLARLFGLGFQKVKFDADYYVDGWETLMMPENKEEDSSWQEDKELKILREAIPPEVHKKLRERFQEEYKKMMKEWEEDKRKSV